jgi:hypothetical protein
MAKKIPYMNSPGTVTKILRKIKTASTPDRFTPDFLATKLGFKGGNARTFIAWAKKMGLLNSDGSPSDKYKKFRNPTTAGAAMASALKKGYAELYDRNEYCHDLNRNKLTELVVDATGLDHDNRVVQMAVSTFLNAKAFAKFDGESFIDDVKEEIRNGKPDEGERQTEEGSDIIDFRLGYTINLVLPKTDDPAVYNAIFKSLRDHLLRK